MYFQVMMIQSYDGDISKLGNAEKFFLQLSKLSGYKIRVRVYLFGVVQCHFFNENQFEIFYSYLSVISNSKY